jgi:hypothetical protein
VLWEDEDSSKGWSDRWQWLAVDPLRHHDLLDLVAIVDGKLLRCYKIILCMAVHFSQEPRELESQKRT